MIKEETYDSYEFVGFHRQRREPSKYDDLFITKQGYGEKYFREILDSLFFKDRDEAMRRGWLDYSWDEHDEKYDQIEDEVADWLNEKGYRWIFVTENRPHGIDAFARWRVSEPKTLFSSKLLFTGSLGRDWSVRTWGDATSS